MELTANSNEIYYVTLTVIDWIDVFTRKRCSYRLKAQFIFTYGNALGGTLTVLKMRPERAV